MKRNRDLSSPVPCRGDRLTTGSDLAKITKGGERHNYRRAVQLKRLPSQAANSSSGSGSKKLSSSFIWPFMEPNCRLPCFRTRTIRATGVPLRAMTTSSPASTFASKRDRLVFASWTFIFIIANPLRIKLAKNIAWQVLQSLANSARARLANARLSTHQRQAPHRNKRIRHQAIEVNPRGHHAPVLVAPVPDKSVAASR